LFYYERAQTEPTLIAVVSVGKIPGIFAKTNYNVN
jgi:hypothetical protein